MIFAKLLFVTIFALAQEGTPEVKSAPTSEATASATAAPTAAPVAAPKPSKAPAKAPSPVAAAKPGFDEKKLKRGLYAHLNTTMGSIIIKFMPEIAPQTVSNFVQLAKGTKATNDPVTQKKSNRKFYDGLTFHRIIPGFVIQGGDPKGDGTGGPGYTIQDELYPNIDFDKAGMVAMANTGRPNTGGSQFFITLDRLSGRLGKTYSIFGEVVEGMDVVEMIAKAPHDSNDKPLKPIVMTTVTIIERK